LHTSTIDAAENRRPATVRSAFVLRVFAAFLVLALLSGLISVGGKLAGRSIAMAGHTDVATPREIVIGNDVLNVPSNMIRFEAARRDGVASRLDLYLRWPQMDGYSAAAKDDFNRADGAGTILFLGFEEKTMSRDMSGRFEPIYRALIDEPGRPGPAGLTVYDFAQKSGYVDEVLVVGDADTQNPFVMRCLAKAAARESLAPCERDIHVGRGLSLTYRMPAGLAGSWREVDAAVRAAAARFLQTGE
jgi:hypothetical protein